MNQDSPVLPETPVLGERYEISRLLREESWGEVWLARDRLLGTEVGLKVLPRQAPEWSAAQGYYQGEAVLAFRLRHPQILGIFHLEDTTAGLFLVQEAFGGESLLALFARQQRFSLPQTLQLLDQVSQALAFAHQRGGVHQALNPLNILVKGDEVRVANFAFPGEDRGQVTTLELKAYDAPEVIYGDTPTTASNVFSLGVLGFRLMAGSLPYALTFDEPFPYRVETLPADLEEIPLPLQNLLLRCLAVDPEERFPDVATFLAQLRQVREQKGNGRPADYQTWEPTKSESGWKPSASRAGALLGKVWQVTQPLAQKVKETSLQAGKAFLSSPRRQLWWLGLVGLLVVIVAIRLNFSTPKLPKEAPVAVPSAIPSAAVPSTPATGGVPPLTESGEPAAPQAQPLAKPGTAAAPVPAPTAGAAPATAPEGAKPKPKEERFMLVAATYANQKQAQTLLQKLKKDNYKAKLVTQTSGGKTQYQVQVGPVTGAKVAEDTARRLKSQEKITPKVMKMADKTKPTTKPANNTTTRRPSR